MNRDLREIVAPLRGRPHLLPAALALLLTYAWFVGPSAWNQNSRLALTRALVERQAVVIDPDHHTTGDKSFREGHFYSDKAPGMSVLATVPYAGFYALRRATGSSLPQAKVVPLDPLERDAGIDVDPAARQPGDKLAYNAAHRIALYVCRLFTTTALAMVGLVAFFLLALRRVDDERTAIGATAIYGLATPALAYGSAFYGHQPCADALLIAFALVILLPDRPHLGSAALTGFALATAVAVEYPAAVPATALGLWATWRRGIRFGVGMVVGALPWAVIVAGYHAAAFGHPLKTGYDFVYLEEFAEGMRVRYGIGAPDPNALGEILFGSYRGLFVLAPVLVLATWGLAVQLVRKTDTERATRDERVMQVCIIGYYLLLNAGYYMWDGGASAGPRHTVPMLGFMALGITVAQRSLPRATWALAAVSVVQVLLLTRAAPEAPQHGHPIWSYAVPDLLYGDHSGYGAATDLGRLLGLGSVSSLALLSVVWAWAWSQGLRSSGTARDRPTQHS